MKLVDSPAAIEVRMTKEEHHSALREYLNAYGAESGLPLIERVHDFRFDAQGEHWIVVQCVPATTPKAEAL